MFGNERTQFLLFLPVCDTASNFIKRLLTRKVQTISSNFVIKKVYTVCFDFSEKLLQKSFPTETAKLLFRFTQRSGSIAVPYSIWKAENMKQRRGMTEIYIRHSISVRKLFEIIDVASCM